MRPRSTFVFVFFNPSLTPQLQIAQWMKDLMSLEGDMPILTGKENNETGGTAGFDVWNHFHSAFQLIGEQEGVMVAGNVVEPDQGHVPTAGLPAGQGPVPTAGLPADQGHVSPAQVPADQGHVSPAQVPADQGPVPLAQLPADQGQVATSELPVDKEVVPTIEQSQESLLAAENLQGTDVEVDDETEASVELESEVVNRTEISVGFETETEHSDVQDKENHQVQEGESQGEQIDLPTMTENVTTQAETTETNLKKLDQTTKDNPQRQGEYFEEVIKFEESSENGPEGGLDTVVTESEKTPTIEVIKVEEDEGKIEVEMETETEANHEAGREVEEGRSWLEEPVNQSEKEDDTSSATTEVFDVSLVNMDLADLGWEESGNESDVTVKWEPKIETLNLNDQETSVSNKVHSLDEMTQESEEESLSSFGIKKTYVAMKSAKIDKVVRKKRKKRSKGNQWKVDSEDTEWTPRKKKAMKIVLVKTKIQESSSESEDGRVPPSPWKKNNHKWLLKEKADMKQNKILKDKQEREDRRRVRNLMITDKNSQASLLQFHKSNWEKAQLMKRQLASELCLLTVVMKLSLHGSLYSMLTNMITLYPVE